MIVGLYLLSLIIPICVSSRMINILLVAVYTIVGAIIYFIVSYKLGLIDKIFGDNLLQKLKKRLRRK